MITYREEVKRKLIHLSSLWIPTAMCLLPRWPLCLFFAVLLILNLLVERARAKQMPIITPLYEPVASPFVLTCMEIRYFPPSARLRPY